MYIFRYLCCFNKKKDTILKKSYNEDNRFSYFLYESSDNNNEIIC